MRASSRELEPIPLDAEEGPGAAPDPSRWAAYNGEVYRHRGHLPEGGPHDPLHGTGARAGGAGVRSGAGLGAGDRAAVAAGLRDELQRRLDDLETGLHIDGVFIEAIHPHPTLSEMMHESVLDAYGRAVHY